MAAAIRSDPDLKVIGLLGAWGSGKSTVVRLLQKHLDADADGLQTYCFNYDAWLHQNDPPRRAFLEALIYFLAKNNLTDLAAWQSQLDQLNRVVEDTETTSTPAFTVPGRWLLLSLFGVPLGMKFLDHSWYNESLKDSASLWARTAFAVGWTLLLLPLLIGFGFYLWWRPIKSPFVRGFFSGKNWTSHDAAHEDQSLLSIVANREIVRQRNRVTRSPEPSSIEFQAVFRNLMKEVSNEKRRLLFVVDNLDRIPEPEAVAMWSTIRSFFLGDVGVSTLEVAQNHPTVILPIDDQAVERMYAATHSEHAPALSQSFMDKTFDLAFRVTRPVLSDWKFFLEVQLKKSFRGKIEDGWAFDIGRIYDSYLASDPAAVVTPRAINTLINQIQLSHMQWHDEGISVAAISYYVLYRKQIAENVIQAVTSPFGNIADIDPEWQRSIAAMHFGVPPSHAAQVLLEQPLRVAISNGNAEALKALVNVVGFEPMFTRYLDEFPAGNPLPVANLAALLTSVGTLETRWAKVALRRMRGALGQDFQWLDFGRPDADAALLLLATCPATEVGALLPALAKRLSSVSPPAFAKVESIRCVLEVLDAAVRAASEAGLPVPKLVLPDDAQVYLNVVAQLTNAQILAHIQSGAADAAVVSALSDRFGAANAASVVPLVRTLVRRAPEFPWDPLVTAAAAVVRDPNSSAVRFGLSVLGALYPVSPAAEKATRELAGEGQLSIRMQEAYPARPDAVATAAALLLIVQPAGAAPDGFSWGDVVAKVTRLAGDVDAALRLAAPTVGLGDLVQLDVDYEPLQPLIGAVIESRFAQKHFDVVPADIVARFDAFLGALSDGNLTELFDRAALDGEFWNALSAAPVTSTTTSLFNHLMASESPHLERAANSLSTVLERLPEADWTGALLNGGNSYDLAELLRQCTGSDARISGHLFEALRGVIGGILASSDSALRERWFILAALLPAATRGTLYKTLSDTLTNGTPVRELGDLLQAGGAQLLTDGNFAEKGAEAVRHLVAPLLKESGGLAWLQQHPTTARAWLSNSEQESREFLEEQLWTLWTEADDATKATIVSVALDWGLEDPSFSPTSEVAPDLENENSSDDLVGPKRPE